MCSSQVNLGHLRADPAQIATEYVLGECISERSLEQHTKNAPKCLLGKYVKFS